MKIKTSIAAILIAVVFSSGANAGAVYDRVKQTGVLVAAADTSTPPSSYLDENNELIGFDIDVGNELAKRLGAKLKIVTPSWDVITAGRWNGRWDISIASMTVTAERQKVLDFPTIYVAPPAALAVHKDNKTITKVEDASGKRIGVQGASTYERYLAGNLDIGLPNAAPIVYRIKDADVVSYDTEGLSLDDLRLGDGKRLDAVVATQQAIDAAVRSGYPIKRVGESLFTEPLAVAIDKGDPEFHAAVKQAMESMLADGTMKRLSEKWFKDDFATEAAKYN